MEARLGRAFYLMLFFGFVGVEWLGERLVFRREMVWEWMRLRGICGIQSDDSGLRFREMGV